MVPAGDPAVQVTVIWLLPGTVAVPMVGTPGAVQGTGTALTQVLTPLVQESLAVADMKR